MGVEVGVDASAGYILHYYDDWDSIMLRKVWPQVFQYFFVLGDPSTCHCNYFNPWGGDNLQYWWSSSLFLALSYFYVITMYNTA